MDVADFQAGDGLLVELEELRVGGGGLVGAGIFLSMKVT